MEILFFVLGILLVLLVFTDFFRTTISNHGAGVIARRICSGVWGLLFKLSGGNGKKKLLANAGLILMLCLLAFWLASVWLGYTLIFSFQPDSVIIGQTKEPTSFLEKLYFTGYTISTMGNGDMVANGNPWKIFSAVVSFSGLIMLTLSITYLIPVLSAVVTKRKLSAFICFIGNNPAELLNNLHGEKGFSTLDKHFSSISSMLLHHKEQHMLYPILHYFHSTDRKYAAPLMLTVLDEALTMLLYHPKLQNYDELEVKILRKAMDEYLYTLQSAFIKPANEVPPIPEIKNLEMLESDSNDDLKEAFGGLEKRRSLLLGLVEKDGWNWKDVSDVKKVYVDLES